MPKKYTANDRLNSVNSSGPGQLSELTQMSKKLPNSRGRMPKMSRISKPSGALVVVLAVACVAWTSQHSEAQGRGAGPSMTPSALRASPAETTAAKAKDPNWKAPRTPWGHPDLEGTWTSDDMRGIPTSRPAAQGERESLTPEEFARRAGGDEASRDRAVNQETILRNEFGVRTFGYTSFIVDPSNGQMPALTQAALSRRKAIANQGTFGGGPWDDFDDFTLYDRCITRGVPGSVMPVLYGNGLRIMQTPNEVVISYEMVHDTRIIPLDGRPHIGPGIRQYMGDARGHFEGDTLVVETTNFMGNTTGVGGNGGGAPTSDVLHVIERITRVAADVLNYEVSITDPKTYSKPVKLLLPLTTQPGYQVLPYECHEGNHAMHNILSAARAEDRTVEDAVKKGLPRPKPSSWLGGVNPAAPEQ